MFFRLISLTLIFSILLGMLKPSEASTNYKKYDLILLHGFTNRHRWGEDFLEKLTDHWGSGKIFILYIDNSDKIWKRKLNGKDIICMGENNFQAGTVSIDEQAKIISWKIDKLVASHQMSPVQQILSHSMGGLIARRLLYLRPGTFANIVTLGTPHQGTRLAYEYDWAGVVVEGEPALINMRPDWVKKFNIQYPIKDNLFYRMGRLYTIAALADPFSAWGWIGELSVGWTMLLLKYGDMSDGVLTPNEAMIKGAHHTTTYKHMDHIHLVLKPEVAEKVGTLLE